MKTRFIDMQKTVMLVEPYECAIPSSAMRNSDMQTKTLVLLFPLCLLSVVSGANPPAGQKTKSGTSTINLHNGYSLELRQDPASTPNAGEYHAVAIKRKGAVLKRLEYPKDEIVARYAIPALTNAEPLITAVDQDINADGIADVVIREYTGGIHCCTIDHIFSLAKDGLHHTELAHGHGDPDLPGGRFIQADDDPALEVRTFDWTFAYWYLPFASSPAPEVVLDYRPQSGSDGGEYRVLNRRSKLATSKWKEMLDRAQRLQKAKTTPLTSDGLAVLLADVLDLLYTGNGHAAREYLTVTFSGREREKLAFAVEFSVQLSSSPYVADVLRLNDCQTIGELLAGKDAAMPAPPWAPLLSPPIRHPVPCTGRSDQ